MKRILKIKNDLGIAGLAALLLLGAALAFSSLVVDPLEKRSTVLKQRASRQAPAAVTDASAGKVAAVHEFLQKDEVATDWLAKLHGIGVATGVQLKSAAYKSQAAEGRIARTEIVLPLSGSYGQIRDFLNRSLTEIPVMSLDQMTIRREQNGSGKSSGELHAELRLTLHMVKP